MQTDTNNSDLILNPKFIPVYPSMIREWYSYLECIVYGFIDFFLANNDKFYCSNQQIADMLWTTARNVQRAFEKLKEWSLIDTSYEVKTWWGKIRYVKLTKPRHDENVVSDTTEMSSQTRQKCRIIYNKIIKDISKDISVEYTDLYSNYYWKKKWINETVCNKLIDAKLKQWVTLEEIYKSMILYNAECTINQEWRYVKKFETWIKEFQHSTDEQLDEQLYTVIKSYRDKKKSDDKFWQSKQAKTIWEELKKTFGEDKVKAFLKQANTINLTFT